MFELLEHPDYIDRLRDEITQTLGTGGWKKSSLYNLKLMDSVLKETLRVHAPGVGECYEDCQYKSDADIFENSDHVSHCATPSAIV